MGDFKKNSLTAHGVMSVIAIIGGWYINSFHLPDNFWLSMGISFGAIFFLCLLVFLFFAVPLERGKLKKSSWRYRWLKFGTGNGTIGESKIYDTINICHLPGFILESIFKSFIWFLACCIIGPIVVFLILTIGNVYVIFFRSEYLGISFAKVEILKNKIPFLPERRIGGSNGIILRLWMLPMLALVFWLIYRFFGDWFSFSSGYTTQEIIEGFKSVSNSFEIRFVFIVAVAFITLAVIKFIFRKIMPWIRLIFISLKNLFRSLDERFCIVGKVLDE